MQPQQHRPHVLVDNNCVIPSTTILYSKPGSDYKFWLLISICFRSTLVQCKENKNIAQYCVTQQKLRMTYFEMFSESETFGWFISIMEIPE